MLSVDDNYKNAKAAVQDHHDQVLREGNRQATETQIHKSNRKKKHCKTVSVQEIQFLISSTILWMMTFICRFTIIAENLATDHLEMCSIPRSDPCQASQARIV